MTQSIPQLPEAAKIALNAMLDGAPWIGAENLAGEEVGGALDAAIFVLQAALSQPLAVAAIPSGMVLVPIEPTVEMTRAAARWLTNLHVMRPIDKTNAINDAYRAMVTTGQGAAK
jgi:hypothetical protein